MIGYIVENIVGGLLLLGVDGRNYIAPGVHGPMNPPNTPLEFDVTPDGRATNLRWVFSNQRDIQNPDTQTCTQTQPIFPGGFEGTSDLRVRLPQPVFIPVFQQSTWEPPPQNPPPLQEELQEESHSFQEVVSSRTTQGQALVPPVTPPRPANTNWLDWWDSLAQAWKEGQWSQWRNKPRDSRAQRVKLEGRSQSQSLTASIYQGPMILVAMPAKSALKFLKQAGEPLSSHYNKLSASLVYPAKGSSTRLYSGHDDNYPVALVLAVPADALLLACIQDIDSPTINDGVGIDEFLDCTNQIRGYCDSIRMLYRKVHELSLQLDPPQLLSKRTLFEWSSIYTSDDTSARARAEREHLKKEAGSLLGLNLQNKHHVKFLETEPLIVLMDLYTRVQRQPALRDHLQQNYEPLFEESARTPVLEKLRSMLEECQKKYQHFHSEMERMEVENHTLKSLPSYFQSMKRPGLFASMTQGHNEMLIALDKGDVEIRGIALVVEDDLDEVDPDSELVLPVEEKAPKQSGMELEDEDDYENATEEDSTEEMDGDVFDVVKKARQHNLDIFLVAME
ncbi:hypothetical protein [Vitiosangium sp. GDMCC 1.1324]|uniref:hypothetical protein n=1 Tax=Vitiosangium sp. (strain GDMCC 1.1324) TaxID=2138576 RepID=UPI000D3BD65F|nr:hypothetical protein [Vitiosangium sp. GDMCC 1.1324]PTL81615.1 hypothetical protein DAT35_21925 [Vitiosangium sp. GDMCC 1.1324]